MTTAIEDVRLCTGSGLGEPRRVVFDGATLLADSAAADEVVDGAGAVVLPGLIDAHMHMVLGRVDLENLVYWGVTTGLDMAAWPAEFVNAMRHEKGWRRSSAPRFLRWVPVVTMRRCRVSRRTGS
ncbi:hypothetical protein [Tsukamurella soli]|uniref:hypothetical protein n=1 Tax=Tsukamurella soli TaxID=644556 RepID=UPI003611D688